MAAINVLAGDFKTGKASSFSFGELLLARNERGWLGYKLENIPTSKIASIEIASEQSARSFLGMTGGAIAGGVVLGTVGAVVGAAALGPIGVAAGLIAASGGKKVTFVIELKDGRRALASTDAKTFSKMQAAIFK